MQERRYQKRPGELFLDRYMPTASDTEREEAYENLRGLISILVRIDDRVTREQEGTEQEHDSRVFNDEVESEHA